MTDVIKDLTTKLSDEVTHAFGITGSSESLQLISELTDSGVNYVSTTHETSAVLMAGVVSEWSDSTGVAISIKGPGLANMLPGIVANTLEGYSSLTISEAYGKEDPDHKMHKRLPQREMVEPYVKGSLSLEQLDRLPELLNLANSEAPGPVHVDLCRDERTLKKSRNTTSSVKCSDEVHKILANSSQPVLLLGSLARRRKWRSELSELNIPVFTTVAAKGVFDESKAHSAGIFTGAGDSVTPEQSVIPSADVIVGLGVRSTEVISPEPFSSHTVFVDEVDEELDAGFNPEISITTKNQELFSDILCKLKRKCWGSEQIQKARHETESELVSGQSWTPADVFCTLNKLGYSHNLVLDTGDFATAGEHLWKATGNRVYIGSSNGRYMGTSVPTAIGLAMIRDDPIFCVVGDGGMKMYNAELSTATAHELPICFIVANNGEFGSIARATTIPDYYRDAVHQGRIDWAAVAAGYDCDSHTVLDAETFNKYLKEWDRNQPIVLDLRFKKQAYRNMIKGVR